ncbi:GAF domain-containing protein [Sinirhodobacter populi]|nr:GAF domain-containing protein [Sinirhodobacter populi]
MHLFAEHSNAGKDPWLRRGRIDGCRPWYRKARRIRAGAVMPVMELPAAHTLRRMAETLNACPDPAAILSQLVEAICRNTGWTTAGVMCIEENDGVALVIARYNPNRIGPPLNDRWTLATSPTRMALIHNAPVLIPDAQTDDDFPGYRDEARERDYRSVAVLPLGCCDGHGRQMVLSVQSPRVMTPADYDLPFIEALAGLAAIALEKLYRLEEEQAVTFRAQAARIRREEMLRNALAEDSLSLIAGEVATLFDCPVLIVDLDGSEIVPGRSPAPETLSDADWARAVAGPARRDILRLARHGRCGAPRFSEAVLDCGGRRLVVPAQRVAIEVDGHSAGALILFGAPGTPAPDAEEVETARMVLGVQMLRSHVRFRNATETSGELYAEIVAGGCRDLRALGGRMRRLGMNPDASARLIAIDLTDENAEMATDLLNVLRRAMGRQPEPACAALVDSMILCHIEDPAGAGEPPLIRRLIDETHWFLGRRPVAVSGRICTALTDYPAVWAECRRIAALARQFGRDGLLSARDFGPYPMLLAAAGTGEVREFVEISVGAILRHDRSHGTQYLATLASFLDQGCRHQACADALGLHVTTLRYRLARMSDLFGIDLSVPEARFSLGLAIRLSGVGAAPA